MYADYREVSGADIGAADAEFRKHIAESRRYNNDPLCPDCDGECTVPRRIWPASGGSTIVREPCETCAGTGEIVL